MKFRFRELSIKRKLLLITMITSITALLISSAVISVSDLREYRREIRENLELQAQLFADMCGASLAFGISDQADENLSSLEADKRIMAATLFDNDGAVFSSYTRENLRNSPPRLEPMPPGSEFTEDRLTVSVAVMEKGERVGTLILLSDLVAIQERVGGYLRVAGFAVLLAFGLTLVLSAQLQETISRPILELARKAKIVAENRDYSVRAEKRSNDEVGRMVDGFNEMLAQIQDRDARLQTARTELEGRVKERTAELTLANEQLRKQVERRQQAEEEQRKLAFLVQNSNDFIGLSDLDGRVLFVNEAGRRMMEIDLGADIARFEVKDFHTEKSLAQQVGEIMPAVRDKGIWEGQSELRRFHSQTPIPVYRSVFMIRNPQTREPICYATVTRDISEQLDLEAQLRQSQKMEAVGQLAAGVAHDFNNILTIIQGNASLLEDDESLNEETRPEIVSISEAVKRAANLTRQLLTFSRKQKIQSRPLDLSAVVGNVAKLLRRVLGEHIELQLNFAPSLPRVNADEGMIEQVVTNLAVNARDAMPQGGRLTIGVASCVLDGANDSRLPEPRRGEFVCLTVSDSGCGMDEDTLEHMFEPFFTTKEVGKGTGLGLSTVYGIVKQHDGWIDAASEIGGGTTFKIFLPSTDALGEPSREAPPAEVSSGRAERVLVVEDEPALLELVCAILQNYGYTIYSAGNGVEALKIWKRRRDEIDLLVTDMVMPGGISGRDLAEQLRRDRPELKILYTSGYSVDVAGDDLELNEGINFIAKPYHPSALARAIRNCLGDESG